MATTVELQALIDTWIESYIKQNIDFRTGTKATSERMNELFNLIIHQGDDTAQTVAYVRDYLRQYKIERTAADTQLLADIQEDNAATLIAVTELKNLVEGYQADTLSLVQNTIQPTADQVSADAQATAANRTAIEAELTAAGTVVSDAAAIYDNLDAQNIKINSIQAQFGIVPIDGGTFFDTYDPWTADGGTF